MFYLYEALLAYYRQGASDGLEGYSRRALRRVWQSVRFSWWMTTMLHNLPDHSNFERRLQVTELDYLFSCEAAATAMAENYVGLPL